MKKPSPPFYLSLVEKDSPYIKEVVRLWRAYQLELGQDLCFQSFEEELRQLPGKYATPRGRIYLLIVEGVPQGSIALKPLSEELCELKRLYVAPQYRGMGYGRILVEKILVEAKDLAYREMCLDTLSSLLEAIALYRAVGFTECAPYYHNPLSSVVYMSRQLV